MTNPIIQRAHLFFLGEHDGSQVQPGRAIRLYTNTQDCVPVQGALRIWMHQKIAFYITLRARFVQYSEISNAPSRIIEGSLILICSLLYFTVGPQLICPTLQVLIRAAVGANPNHTPEFLKVRRREKERTLGS